MKVQELMTREPVTCRSTENCATVGGLMREHRCGFIPVMDDGVPSRIVGVVTDRDL